MNTPPLTLPPGVLYYLEGVNNHAIKCYVTKPLASLEPAEALAQGFAVKGDLWVKLNPVTYALIWSAYHVGLPRISKYNVLEWKYRLDCLADVGIFFLSSPTPDGPVPLKLAYSEIQSHIGLRTSLEVEWSASQFDYFIRQKRMEALKETLRDHDAAL